MGLFGKRGEAPVFETVSGPSGPYPWAGSESQRMWHALDTEVRRLREEHNVDVVMHVARFSYAPRHPRMTISHITTSDGRTQHAPVNMDESVSAVAQTALITRFHSDIDNAQALITVFRTHARTLTACWLHGKNAMTIVREKGHTDFVQQTIHHATQHNNPQP